MRVFVYGTLKKGFHNNQLLGNSEFLGQFKTEPRFTMFSFGGFPAVSIGGTTPIKGEIYQIQEEGVLDTLDRLEGHPNWYKRERIDTPFGKAWIYIMPSEPIKNLPLVSDGDWK